MKIITKGLFFIAVSSFLFLSTNAQETEAKSTTHFTFGGFVKADALFTQYNNGSYTGAGRDFHIPSLTPVGDENVYRYTDFHAKSSRFNFDVSTLAGGKKLRAFAEMDFMLSAVGDERISNSYNPRLRHFFLEYDKILAGQTWSTFMIVLVPDELDFIGSPEGVVFCRQPQVRVTLGSWQVSLENPYVTYNADTTGSRSISESAWIPDAVVRKNFKGDWGNFSVAAIGRQLSYLNTLKTNKIAFGGGVTLGGKLNIGSKDDIRFVATAGSGLGRYLALNFVNSSVVDNNGDLDPIFTLNGYVAYLHHWNSKFRTSTSISYIKANNDTKLTGNLVSDMAYSISTNLIYSPAKNLIFGVEPIYAYRENAGGIGGDFYRLQFTAKYAFSFKTSTGN
jgi:hypothetical protein